ncbi:hypothetical protein AC790_10325 [Pantoea sp. RIT-PI-b]|uniref:hypothetical protein n=1 Tax=Pantoea sp. RIT-PI-b TaxID=1681195 RepID=UPI0006767166|nr:hypothetical protein [Pantoea sp. RIT-PI-b]KNC13400.1 hypothetical protein AC790_10325 [Pantoea sp. RIT-PI-b]
MLNGIGSSVLRNLIASNAVVTPTVNSKTAQNALTAEASTKVTFSEASDAIAAIYKIVPAQVQSSVDVTSSLQAQLNGAAQAKGVGMNGLGRSMLSNLASNRGDVTLSVPATDTVNSAQSSSQSALALTITTQSGVQVSLQMTRQQGGMVVELKTSGGQLNNDEAAAIGSLSAGLQKALDGLDASTTQLDISDLMKFDSSVLKSVDLKTDLRNGNNVTQSLNLHADDQERWLGFHNGDVSIKLDTDMSKLTQAGSAAQQAAALDQWSTKLDQAAARGHGNSAMLSLFKESFRALNTTEGKAAESINTQRVKAIDANAAKSGAISGLADFSATYQQTPISGNPYKPEEEDSFSLNVAQKTTTQQHGDSQDLSQQTLFKLKASFHTALDSASAVKLTEQKSSQNYKYHLIDDEERSQTSVTQNKKGDLTANYSQQLTQNETVKTYQLAQLIDSVEIPHSAKSESSRSFAAAQFDAQLNN